METLPSHTPSRGQRLWARLRDHAATRSALGFYQRHERFAPALFFFGGVTWDALTLTRIDFVVDNVLLLLYLVVAGVLLVLATMTEHGRTEWAWCHRYRTWFPHALQFFLGALFSASVIYYFQSVSWTESTVFFLLLVALLVGNEFLHRRLANVYLLVTLYFVACFSFFIFFIPILVKDVSRATFFAGGGLSVLVAAGLLLLLKRRGVLGRWREFGYALGIVGVLFGTLSLFYLQNWIPPVPLALRHGGVYHHVSREGDAYRLVYEQPEWYAFWVDGERVFRYTSGDTVYCFTAVFAPTRLEKEVYHVWQFYDEATRTWETTDALSHRVVGGRDGGYRGYTLKRHVRPGDWRVNVRTDDGLLLGRIRFQIEAAEQPPTLRRVLYR